MSDLDEDHRPELEELIQHLITGHGCGLARSLVKMIETQAVANVKQNVSKLTLPPGETHRVDVRLGDALAEAYGRFHLLHDRHHRSRAGYFAAHDLGEGKT